MNQEVLNEKKNRAFLPPANKKSEFLFFYFKFAICFKKGSAFLQENKQQI